jgi:hypothetical protein
MVAEVVWEVEARGQPLEGRRKFFSKSAALGRCVFVFRR